ncbi:MAG: hypothetical protein V7603_323 [Micromonosporaceae bacterium]|jgi:hypothetical protein
MATVLRLFGSRYVLAVALVLGIGAVILIGKALGGPASPSGVTAGAPSAVPTVIASGQEDDGVEAPESPPAPATSAGGTRPEKLTTQFLTAWLRHANVTPDAWYAGLKRYMTDNLAGELAGVDPAGVPASRITGNVTLIDHDTNFVEATVPVDSGIVTLRLLATDGRWLVDGVDWTRT